MKRLIIVLLALLSLYAGAQEVNRYASTPAVRSIFQGRVITQNGISLSDTVTIPAELQNLTWLAAKDSVIYTFSAAVKHWVRAGGGIGDTTALARKLDVYNKPQADTKFKNAITAFSDSSGFRICQGDTCWDFVFPVAEAGSTTLIRYGQAPIYKLNDSTLALDTFLTATRLYAQKVGDSIKTLIPAGPQGPQGPQGATGPTGPAGPGVPAGGAAGNVLIKTSATDYATEWGAYANPSFITSLAGSKITYIVSSSGDVDYAPAASAGAYYLLTNITANRTFTIPSLSNGSEITVSNTYSGTTYAWNLSATIYYPNGTTATSLKPSSAVRLRKDNSGLWRVINEYQVLVHGDVFSAGKAGGQSLAGGTAAGENLTLRSTSNAAKGKIFFGDAVTTFYDGVSGYWTLNSLKTNGTAPATTGYARPVSADEIGQLSFAPNAPPLDEEKEFYVFNDFWQRGAPWPFGEVTSGGTSGGTTNGSQNRIGIWENTTGTTSTGYSGVASEEPAIKLGAGIWSFETEVQIPTLSNGTDRFTAYHGFADDIANTLTTDMVGFIYDEGGIKTGTASPNWQLVTSAGGTRTFTTTPIAVNAATWYRLKWESDATGSTISFYINGSLVANHTTNIPTTTSTGIQQNILKALGTTSRNMLIDFTRVRARFTNPRQ